jgi:hypothetical protein
MGNITVIPQPLLTVGHNSHHQPQQPQLQQPQLQQPQQQQPQQQQHKNQQPQPQQHKLHNQSHNKRKFMM